MIANYKSKGFILFLMLTLFFACQKQKPTLFLIGDSTMADKEKMYLPERGWGQLLPQFFSEEINIENHAKNGRSTRSFIYQGRWDSVCNKMQAGDFVLIQFGHNDGSMKKTERYATPVEYEYNFRKFIHDTRQHKAIPILATSVARRRFDSLGVFYDTHGEYPGIVREIAADLKVPLLEMHEESMALLSDMGEEKTKAIFLHIEAGQNDSLPDGKIDNTHFSEYGAIEMSKIAVGEIKKNVPELAIYLK